MLLSTTDSQILEAKQVRIAAVLMAITFTLQVISFRTVAKEAACEQCMTNHMLFTWGEENINID